MERRELAVGVGVGVSVLAILAVGVGWETVVSRVLAADLQLFALAVVASALSIIAWTLSVYALVHRVPNAPGARQFAVLYLSSSVVKQVLPLGSASGPAVIAYVVSRYSDVSLERILLATTVSGFLGVVASGVVAVVGLFVVMATQPVPAWLLRLVLGLVSVGVVLLGVVTVLAIWPSVLRQTVLRLAGALHPSVTRLSSRAGAALEPSKVRTYLDRFIETGELVAEAPRSVALSFLGSILGWLLMAAALTLSLEAVRLPASYALAMFAVPVSGVATVVPLPGGLGGVEATLSTLVSLATGNGVASVGAGIVLYRLSTFWFRLLVGSVAAVATLGRHGVGSRALKRVETEVGNGTYEGDLDHRTAESEADG
ncbi:lysylphosphatidylglycerol synthase transmembrane domain-containing protein [Haloarchaeobius sp. HRN-SO-5]|uniref:lysylphosphatidylglycerol synthase transmembrane domain-containing protein n=1 Tax=Haloarchaeobius sp. HRN-SO-5 TaxID=3446118 RepID=UPI003EBC76BD